MTENPRYLHSSGNAILGKSRDEAGSPGLKYLLTAASFLGIFFGLGWTGALLYRWLDVPVVGVAITSPFLRVDRAELENLVNSTIEGKFLTLDLKALCRTLEEHPWLAKVTARRTWPNQISIVVVEEVPIARWGDKGFLNQSGELLAVSDNSALTTLPVLSGLNYSVREVMQNYRDVSESLIGHDLKVTELSVGAHHRWRLRVDAGFLILLGERHILGRLDRFTKVWKDQLKERKNEVLAVDARYANGVAVTWR